MESVGAQGHFTREPETGFQRGMPGFLLRWRGEEFEVVSAKGSGLGDTMSVVAADLEGDGDVDLMVGQNNDRLLTLENK
jgi:LDH2 family malate/lactate/ureidoglycolate dehydrogenase